MNEKIVQGVTLDTLIVIGVAFCVGMMFQRYMDDVSRPRVRVYGISHSGADDGDDNDDSNTAQ